MIRGGAFLGMVLLAGCSTGCASILTACNEGLRLAIEVPSSPVVMGQELEVTFVLTNAGIKTLEACFGEAFEVTFWNGHEARGWVQVIDHPGCVQRFSLPPAGQVARVYKAEVPVISAGVAKVRGGVQVVDPAHCDRYGCDRTWVKATAHPEVTLIRAGK